jgi:hypothetical protein
MADHKIRPNYFHSEHDTAHGCTEAGGNPSSGCCSEHELRGILIGESEAKKRRRHEHAADDDGDVNVGAFSADLQAGSDSKAKADDFAEEAGGGEQVARVGALSKGELRSTSRKHAETKTGKEADRQDALDFGDTCRASASAKCTDEALWG